MVNIGDIWPAYKPIVIFYESFKFWIRNIVVLSLNGLIENFILSRLLAAFHSFLLDTSTYIVYILWLGLI